MFDKIIVNIKSILPKNSTSDKNDRNKETESNSVPFIEHNHLNMNSANQTNLMGYFRSYFDKLGTKNLSEVDSIMLPRVYAPIKVEGHFIDWDPIELMAKEKFIDDIDNVIDKFARVISVNESDSPRRTHNFYVQFYFLFFHFDNRRKFTFKKI